MIMYEIEVMYANGSIEIFDHIEKYEVVCNGLIFKLYYTNSDIRTMIPVSQVIRIGKINPIAKEAIYV